MPADPVARKKLEELDPWRIRGEGLDRPLSLHELGRVIFHLNQRRGFKSNRKTERGDKKKPEKEAEAKSMTDAAKKLTEYIGPDKPNARTLGEYLYKTRRANFVDNKWIAKTPACADTVRARPLFAKGQNTYEFYPVRAMISAEFNALWAAQAKHHPDLVESARLEIEGIVFFQRRLRPVEPGFCTLDTELNSDKRDRRAPLALPIQQEFRILQELANLELYRRENPTIRKRLSLAQRDKLFEVLRRSKQTTFAQIRNTKLLGIESNWVFNLQSERRKDLKGDIVSEQLGKDRAFGERWYTLSDDTRQEIVRVLFDEEDEEKILEIYATQWGLTQAQAKIVANTHIPEGYGSLGLKALSNIVPLLKSKTEGLLGRN